ncbi:tetratricopeptide repeat protein, partial [Ostertagia ostertagi]
APGLQSSVELIIFLAKLVSELGDTTAAIQAYERALQSILAAGSIMQAHGDHDVALNKYRVAVDACDYNGCLWNNIGVCLMAKGRLAQAHSCLKKASFICPLDYKYVEIEFKLSF